MKIESIHTSGLQNGEHFMFMNEVSHIIKSNNPQAIDLAEVYAGFSSAIENEDVAFKKTQKSVLTKDISETDSRRDDLYRGFRSQVKTMLKHFDPAVSESAYRLKVLLDAYGDLATQSYDNETANLINIILDLKGKFAADVTALGLGDWAAKLEETNDEFDALMKNRYGESAEKADIDSLRNARIASDNAYKAMRERMNAAVIFNGEAKYSKTIGEWNVVIKRYNDMQAR